MNYLKVYCNLIRKAEKRTALEGYVEEHHIFPISVYGENKRTVKLTAREHYIAHALLEKIFIKRYGEKDIRSIKMTYAFSFMNRHTNQNDYCNSYLYEGCRIRYARINSFMMHEYYKDKLSYWKGKKFSDEHCKKISQSLSGRKLSEQHIEIMRQNNLGKKHSEKTKQKIKEKRAQQVFSKETNQKRGLSYKNKVWMYDPQSGKQYRINKDDIENKILSGLVIGRGSYFSEETKMKLSLSAKKQWEKQRNN